MNGRAVACVGKHVHILAVLTKDLGRAMAGRQEQRPLLMQWHIPAITKLKQPGITIAASVEGMGGSQLGGI